MNGKQYNNVIDWTLKHEAEAQSEDSLEATRAICKNLGVALPGGTMKKVADTLATDDYMYWRSCTMQDAQEAADNGTAAIGISNDRIVVLTATDEEQPVAETAAVMTLSENTSAFAVDGLRYYAYGGGTTTTTIQPHNEVTVISCSPQAWIASSETMGHDMSVALQAVNRFSVDCPSDADHFKSCWASATNCVVIHTHGGPYGLYDEECDENGNLITPLIISTSELEDMPRNYTIRFVIMTACKTASGNETDNVAYWLSKKISPNGIVVANKYTVSGDDTEFNGILDNGTPVPGWMVYKNGVAESLPMTTLTMETAYQIFEEYR